MRKPETNIEFLKRIMSVDALKQAFIISAIDSYARHVAESEPIEHGFIDGCAWKDCAQQVLSDLANRGQFSGTASFEQWSGHIDKILADHDESITVGDSRQLHERYWEGEDSHEVAIDLLAGYGIDVML